MEKQRIISVDYGLKRVGIAITDPLRIFAYPLTTLKNDNNFWSNFRELMEDYDVEFILLGYPVKEDGSRSSSTEMVEEFRAELEKRFKIRIEYADEKYSSEIAKERILNSVSSRKKRRDKGLVDKNAAAILLEDYLQENT